MSAEDNKARALRLFDQAFNQHNLAVVEEIIGAAYVDHSAMPAPAPGPEGFRRRIEALHAAFDATMALANLAGDGDLVGFTWTISGTHEGTFAGVAPTGKAVTVNGVNLERFEDGKIVEHWSQFDMVGLMRQIGALPPPGQARS